MWNVRPLIVWFATTILAAALIAWSPPAAAETTAAGIGVMTGCGDEPVITTGFMHDTRQPGTLGTFAAGAGDPASQGFYVVLDESLGVVGGAFCGHNTVDSFSGSWNCVDGTLSMSASHQTATLTFESSSIVCDF